jgi:hypothetical protein
MRRGALAPGADQCRQDITSAGVEPQCRGARPACLTAAGSQVELAVVEPAALLPPPPPALLGAPAALAEGVLLSLPRLCVFWSTGRGPFRQGKDRDGRGPK